MPPCGGNVRRVKPDAPTQPYVFVGDTAAPLLATAIHAGHELRPEVAALMELGPMTRFREEDPFTDELASCAVARVLVSRSRFEVDLNRARDAAVYRTPEECWGLEVWKRELPEEVADRSLDLYDAFYTDLARHLDRLAESGPFVVYDVHSYNHRRRGADEPDEDAPDINVGTKALRGEWRGVVEAFIDTLDGYEVQGHPLDVRENIVFQGANLSRWVAERYRGVGCSMALEFKKAFMNEWTGDVDAAHLAELTAALGDTIPVVLDALGDDAR